MSLQVFLIIVLLSIRILLAMRPKRKTSSPPPDGRQVKKVNQSEPESIPTLTGDDDIERPKLGKMKIDNGNEGKGFCRFTTKHLSTKPSEKKNGIKEAEIPNL